MGKLFSAVLMVLIAYVIIYANQSVQATVSKRGSAKIPTPTNLEGRHARGLFSKYHGKKHHEEQYGTCTIVDILNDAFCEYSDKAYVEEMVSFIHKASRELALTRHKLYQEIPIVEYYQREELAETLDKAGDIFYRLSYNLHLPYNSYRDILSQLLDDGSSTGEDEGDEYEAVTVATSKPTYTVSSAASYSPTVETPAYSGTPGYQTTYNLPVTGGVSGGNYQSNSYPGVTYQIPKVYTPNYYAQTSNPGGYNYASPQSTGTYYAVGKGAYQPQYVG